MKFLSAFGRYFSISFVLTVIVLAIVWWTLGFSAFLTALMLVIIELTFSFDNSIVNAKILTTMSPFWQRMFTTVGIVIAVFGMRIVFPIVLVMVVSGLDSRHAVDLALNHPYEYSRVLLSAHTIIFSFGGMFLAMLGLTYFFDRERKIHWIDWLETRLQRIATWWMPTVIAAIVLAVIAYFAPHNEGGRVLIFGTAGIVLFLVMHGIVLLLESRQPKNTSKSKTIVKTGLAGFASFMYLEVLDASFSFDGVIGALALTQNIVLIAAGLGVGALWIRSMTLFMVRKGTLHTYRYLEHGAHYTILLLASVMLAGLYVELPEAVPALGGLMVIVASIIASVQQNRRDA